MKTRAFMLALCLVGYGASLFSQKHDYVWTFGHNYGLVDSMWGGTNIDFNKSPVAVNWVERKHSLLDNGLACISDADGQLAFFTSGCYLINRFEHIIEDGDTLNWYDDEDVHLNCLGQNDGSGYGTDNPVYPIILPIPDTNKNYVVVHKSMKYYYLGSMLKGYSPDFSLTYVDMSLNGGEGKVTEQRTLLSTRSP